MQEDSPLLSTEGLIGMIELLSKINAEQAKEIQELQRQQNVNQVLEQFTEALTRAKLPKTPPVELGAGITLPEKILLDMRSYLQSVLDQPVTTEQQRMREQLKLLLDHMTHGLEILGAYMPQLGAYRGNQEVADLAQAALDDARENTIVRTQTLIDGLREASAVRTYSEEKI
jgi:hypothetical protein